MPTVSIVYSLPEEEEEYQVHMHAMKYAVAIEDVDNKCRALIKWSENPSDDAIQLAEDIREIIREVLYS